MTLTPACAGLQAFSGRHSIARNHLGYMASRRSAGLFGAPWMLFKRLNHSPPERRVSIR